MKKSKLILTVAGSALMVAAAFTSCKKSSSSLPAIGGYNTSNDVAATNLLAHWTFESTLNETISNTAPTTSTGITYTTGVDGKGKAAQFSNGYAIYPSIAALSTATTFANGFTVSAWVKVANNKTATSGTVSTIFALSSPVDSQYDWNDGPIEMYVETQNYPATSDTIQLHTAFSSYVPGTGYLHADNVNAYGVADSDYFYVIAADSTWIHYVALYNASTSIIQIYANNVLVSNTAFQYRANGSNPFGAINILTPTQVVLGSFANTLAGGVFTADASQVWQGLFTGTMDNLRVYNAPLSVSDISALYNLELAGR